MAMSPQELAQAVRDEEMSFQDALLHHLVCNLGIAVEDVALFMGLTLAIGWAQLERWDEIIDLPSGPVTVNEIIERFQLQAFLEN